MSVVPSRQSAKSVTEVLKSELRKLKRCSDSTTTCEPRIAQSDAELESTYICIDETLLRAVIAELLRNAQKATARRLTMRTNILNNHISLEKACEAGWTNMEDPWLPEISGSISLMDGSLRLLIEDNGDACANTKVEKLLRERFAAAQDEPYDLTNMRLGLAYCILAMRTQGINVALSQSSTFTRFTVDIPLLQ